MILYHLELNGKRLNYPTETMIIYLSYNLQLINGREHASYSKNATPRMTVDKARGYCSP